MSATVLPPPSSGITGARRLASIDPNAANYFSPLIKDVVSGGVNNLASLGTFTFTVPASAAAGDWLYLLIGQAYSSVGAATLYTVANGGNTFTNRFNTSTGSAPTAYGQALTRVATAGDAGATYTVTAPSTLPSTTNAIAYVLVVVDGSVTPNGTITGMMMNDTSASLSAVATNTSNVNNNNNLWQSGLVGVAWSNASTLNSITDNTGGNGYGSGTWAPAVTKQQSNGTQIANAAIWVNDQAGLANITGGVTLTFSAACNSIASLVGIAQKWPTPASILVGQRDKGPWVQLFASTPWAVNGIDLSVMNTSASSTPQDLYVDIGIGAAGSESILVPSLYMPLTVNFAGSATGSNAVNYHAIVPVVVPAGSRVAVRGMGRMNGTASTGLPFLNSPSNTAGVVATLLG